jgi:predicted small secreted protein
MIRVVVALGLATCLLAACNTVEGAGRDLSAAGDAMADSAAKVQRQM